MLFSRGGGSWQTSYNTLYSQSTSNNFWSYYDTSHVTNWAQDTWKDRVTSVATGYNFTTQYFTSVETNDAHTCVHIDSFILGALKAKDINVGDELVLADEKTLEPGKGIVTYSKQKYSDGFRIETIDGAVLLCSKTAPIPTRDKGCLTPNKLLGEFVATNIDGHVGWSRIKTVNSISNLPIQHITVQNKCFWAGEFDGKYILHHNLKSPGETNFFMTDWVTQHLTGTAYLSYFWTGWSESTAYSQNTTYQTSVYTGTTYTTSWNVVTYRITYS